MMYWGNGTGWGYFFMVAWMVLFWGLVIGAIILAVRAINRPTQTRPAATDPQQILARRLAQGEIDETEYQQRLAALRPNTAPAPRQ